MNGAVGVDFQWYFGAQTKFLIFLILLNFNFPSVQQAKFTMVAQHHQIPHVLQADGYQVLFSNRVMFVQKLDWVRCWMSATCWRRRVILLSLLVEKKSVPQVMCFVPRMFCHWWTTCTQRYCVFQCCCHQAI